MSATLTIREKQKRAGTSEGCDEIERHTACPRAYDWWHEWAEKMSKTHNQVRCPCCGFLSIWIPRPSTQENPQPRSERESR